MCGPAVMFLQCSYVFKSYAYNYLYSYSLLCYVKFYCSAQAKQPVISKVTADYFFVCVDLVSLQCAVCSDVMHYALRTVILKHNVHSTS